MKQEIINNLPFGYECEGGRHCSCYWDGNDDEVPFYGCCDCEKTNREFRVENQYHIEWLKDKDDTNMMAHLVNCNQGEYKGSCKYGEKQKCFAFWE